MKNILLVYSKMVVGGSTTSLISLLNSIDYTQYSVDLLLHSNEGELQEQINKNVTVLPPVGAKVNRFQKLIHPGFWISLLLARMHSSKEKNQLINAQYMAKYEALASPKTGKHYDAAISFLEFWPMEFIARRVKADRKIGWLHIDIVQAGLRKGVNADTYRKMDTIVLVSKSCKANMDAIYPQFSKKTVVIENLLATETIVNFSKATAPVKIEGSPIFVTACRLVLASKGLDRAVRAFARLKEEGILPAKARWYIIGDGPDRGVLEAMIKESGLEDTIILLGQHSNPCCIEKDADFFLLPSRYEGKPMAVTEAQMLGLVPIVCEYSSAREQIRDGVDGIIAENNDADIVNKLKALFEGKYDMQEMKRCLRERELSNIEEIEKIYALL